MIPHFPFDILTHYAVQDSPADLRCGWSVLDPTNALKASARLACLFDYLVELLVSVAVVVVGFSHHVPIVW